ncbi:MAG: methylated-DNA--[protein]-cysteine S-methyltransferase [Elusimicrobia bacterium]|nr:methylated-DNA--[protein]-cysteine S-methyltransferase [Elusimicrobiota bacterium]MBD3412586.1 methylated-DNA--[protein]-cysteine S-methyltransferase [Elusimicrobiota bacterium]
MKQYSLFKQQVWVACASIPRGQTRSYSWIARKIKKPRAVRAVGSALAANPFAPNIPCHRVIRKNGHIGRYSGHGGSRTKKRLLDRERNAVQ